jgi:hypothetical protein
VTAPKEKKDEAKMTSDSQKPAEASTAAEPPPGATRPTAIDLTKANDAHLIAMDASTGGPSVLSKFTLPVDYAEENQGVKRKLVRVPVRRPHRTWWWWTRLDYMLRAAILADESGGQTEIYLVTPDLMPELGSDVVPATLHGAINRQGTFFVITARLPGADGRLDGWTESLREALVIAQSQPVRTASNRDLGAYDIFTTPSQIEMPAWPEESWEQLITVAFKDKVIESVDHPVVRRLRGEV